ncbi:DUF6941 family protein [Synoicihabitans lomoniglobus]|uniref:Uncharacterized protein n=1 Tax=Synoicihabitans lomoniglobus TaxID=2909285 RepID=A0AAF0I4X1_9BACT|nr:hypothetical protein [Opitutaceae bacterium LMO-M01]WED66720.1 hypothetical protein PXH66_07640 [Opitutaceae bacterium LMO-M01]
MKVELFTICDFAADYGGKLNVVGIFDTIFAGQTPFVHPRWCVALKLRFEKMEEGDKKIRLSLVDDDGKSVLEQPIELNINVKLSPDQNQSIANIVLNLDRIQFNSFGEHAVDLAINGRHEGRLSLFTSQRQC